MNLKWDFFKFISEDEAIFFNSYFIIAVKFKFLIGRERRK